MPRNAGKNTTRSPRGKGPRLERSAKATQQKIEQLGFGNHIARFVAEVEGLSRAKKMTTSAVLEALKKHSESFLHFIQKRGVKTSGEKGDKSFHLKPSDLASFKRYTKDLSTASWAFKNVPRIFFCSLVHQYDAYLGRVLRESFNAKPDILRPSQKQLSFSDLVGFPSIEAARRFLIEKEVESVIRDSHIAHFEWMENRFGIELRKELSVWPQFVELTERRNLFVHCDGVVSSQYLDVRTKHGAVLEKPLKVGDQLEVSEEYFDSAVDCMLEIGVKLGHVLWRKLAPHELEKADDALHRITYEFLSDEWYSLAKVLLLFAVNTLKKQSSDSIKRMNLINLAIALKFSGERDAAAKLLEGQDWSACEDKFKLAVAVLEGRKDEAIGIMRGIGSKGSVTREAYSSWPVFKEFRKAKEFLDTYKELFGEEFILVESEVESPLQRVVGGQQRHAAAAATIGGAATTVALAHRAAGHRRQSKSLKLAGLA